MDNAQLIQESIKEGHSAIRTADFYLSEINNCISGVGACPTKLFELNDPTSWKKELEEAKDRLTFSRPGMEIQKGFEPSTYLPEGLEESAKGILTFSGIPSSKSKDRDGDIINPMGISFIGKCPLLWQHMAMTPVGKVFEPHTQNKDMVANGFAIGDTALGWDCKSLVELDALSLSIGFMPEEIEPIKNEKSGGGLRHSHRSWVWNVAGATRSASDPSIRIR